LGWQAERVNMKRAKVVSQPTPLQAQIAAVVERLGRGEVVSFGDVAARAGHPHASRAAGAVLATAADLPWWRVVYADGQLPPCNPSLQAERLGEEGVQLRGFRVIRSPHGRFTGSSPGKS
jgi:methylated-DNA-protein-cysteine methyltransferase-like protein